MTEIDSDRPPHAVLASEKLLGLRCDCDIPYCAERARSTGWLLYHVEAAMWFVGFRCPAHGLSAAWRPEWQAMIAEVLASDARESVDVAASVRALRGQPGDDTA